MGVQRPKHIELIGIINKPLLLYLVGVYIIYITDARSNKYQMNKIYVMIISKTYFSSDLTGTAIHISTVRKSQNSVAKFRISKTKGQVTAICDNLQMFAHKHLVTFQQTRL